MENHISSTQRVPSPGQSAGVYAGLILVALLLSWGLLEFVQNQYIQNMRYYRMNSYVRTTPAPVAILLYMVFMLAMHYKTKPWRRENAIWSLFWTLATVGVAIVSVYLLVTTWVPSK